MKRFSGIFDKNGKEIREGDTLQWEADLDKDCIGDDGITTYLKTGIVTYQNGYFSCDEDNPFELCMNTVNNKNAFVEILFPKCQ